MIDAHSIHVWYLHLLYSILYIHQTYLGGGFKDFLFSALLGEDFQFDYYFSDGLKPPTSYVRYSPGCLGDFEFSKFAQFPQPFPSGGTRTLEVTWFLSTGKDDESDAVGNCGINCPQNHQRYIDLRWVFFQLLEIFRMFFTKYFKVEIRGNCSNKKGTRWPFSVEQCKQNLPGSAPQPDNSSRIITKNLDLQVISIPSHNLIDGPEWMFIIKMYSHLNRDFWPFHDNFGEFGFKVAQFCRLITLAGFSTSTSCLTSTPKGGSVAGNFPCVRCIWLWKCWIWGKNCHLCMVRMQKCPEIIGGPTMLPTDFLLSLESHTVKTLNGPDVLTYGFTYLKPTAML